jgi:hypothetical protein
MTTAAKLQIMVVDDDESIRDSLALVLQASGYETVTETACGCVGGVKSHPLQKRQRMGHPRDGNSLIFSKRCKRCPGVGAIELEKANLLFR